MLTMPDAFFGDHTISLADGVIAHVFIRDQLIQFEESPGPCPWQFYERAGLRAVRIHGLGSIDGIDHIGVALDDTMAVHDLPTGFRAANLRAWFGELDETTLGIGLRAVQVLEWDRTHQYCGACSALTELVEHERARRCPSCKMVIYPRIAPAMMVLVTRGKQLLLGRGVNFPPGRYSALAGFVEAGETIEQTVHREVFEEVGIQVEDLKYFSSQSWPFPNSLMIAYTAKYKSGELNPDPTELADAQWFDLDALPALPPGLSIAGDLIQATLADLRA